MKSQESHMQAVDMKLPRAAYNIKDKTLRNTNKTKNN